VAPSIFIIVSFFSFSFFTCSDSFGTCQYKRLLHGNADSKFQQVYDERFQAKYGFWHPVVKRSLAAFLPVGICNKALLEFAPRLQE